MPDLPIIHRLPTAGSKHQSSVETWGQGRGGRPWERKRAAVFRRDKYLCQDCLSREILTTVSLHGDNHGVCDHKVPLSEGGSDTLDNLQCLCQACSKIKTQLESQRAGGIPVTATPPRHQKE